MIGMTLNRLLGVLALAGCLIACDRAASPVQSSPASGRFSATEVQGLTYGQGIVLADAHGVPRRLTDFQGKVVIVFFGFTSCPDICPTTLAALAQIRRDLGAAGESLQVVFITVDPDRDLPERLRQYTEQFDSSFVALRPEPQQLPAVLESFRAIATKMPLPGSDDYMMDHSAVKYVYDRRGQLRLIAASDLPSAALATDLTILVRERIE